MATRAQKIQEYMKKSGARQKGVVKLELDGKKVELDVFSIPWEYFTFNIENGRLAKEIMAYQRRNNVQLDPENKNDALVLRKMLLGQSKAETDLLKDSISRLGQLEPGIVTHDGIVVNANRRLAVLQDLAEKKGEARFRFMEVAVLPEDVNERDLWLIEGGLQLSPDPRLGYSPINERIKIRRGLAAGVTEAEMALALGGKLKASDISEMIEELTLIESYLGFIGKPEEYDEAEGKMNHFIDLRSIIDKAVEEGVEGEELLQLHEACFHHIQQDLPHRELREVRKILEHAEARKVFISPVEPGKNKKGTSNKGVAIVLPERKSKKKASKVPPAKGKKSSVPTRLIEPKQIPVSNGGPPKEDMRHAFERARDIARSAADAEKPGKLAERALDALTQIPLDSPQLKDKDVIRSLKGIEKKAKELLARAK